MKQSQSKESKENQRNLCKNILRRTGKFQSYFNEMWQLISGFAVKVASLRDKNDNVAKCIRNFKEVEEFSTSSKVEMIHVADLLSKVGDYQDLAVQKMETLVLPNLSSYGHICDSVKADVVNAMNGIKRENSKLKTLSTFKRKKATSGNNPKVKNMVENATREYEIAAADTQRLCQLSHEHVVKFEHKRLMDIKEALGNFIKIQIATHAKSLELLSQAYQRIQSIDEETDLRLIASNLKIHKEPKFKPKLKPSLKKIKAIKTFKTESENSETESSFSK